MSGNNLGTVGDGKAGGPMAEGAGSNEGEGMSVTPESIAASEGGTNEGAADPAVNVPDSEAVNDMVNKLVQEQLAPIKEKLDSAYEERDKANSEAAKLREAAKQAEIQRLQEDGKEAEAMQLKYSELEGKYTALLEQNTQLTRDQLVDNSIAGLDFLNESAKRMAKTEIIAELVQDSDGQWVHKSGVSVKEAVDVYAKEKDKAFLFRQKTSSGASTVQPGVGTKVDNNAPYMTKPVSELTFDEMVQAQRAGRFGEQEQRVF